MAFLGTGRGVIQRYEWVYAWHADGRVVAGPLYYAGIEWGKVAAEHAIKQFDLTHRAYSQCKLTVLERHKI